MCAVLRVGAGRCAWGAALRRAVPNCASEQQRTFCSPRHRRAGSARTRPAVPLRVRRGQNGTVRISTAPSAPLPQAPFLLPEQLRAPGGRHSERYELTIKSNLTVSSAHTVSLQKAVRGRDARTRRDVKFYGEKLWPRCSSRGMLPLAPPRAAADVSTRGGAGRGAFCLPLASLLSARPRRPRAAPAAAGPCLRACAHWGAPQATARRLAEEVCARSPAREAACVNFRELMPVHARVAAP